MKHTQIKRLFRQKAWLIACLCSLMCLPGLAQNNRTQSNREQSNRTQNNRARNNQAQREWTSPPLSDYFTTPATSVMTPDEDGFIRRWLLLEPIDKPNRSNTVFTDSYIRQAFATEYFPNQFTVLPKDGDKVKVGKQRLKWHALDSKLFNVKLFRFASGLKKQVYGVLFWAVTVIDCPEDIENVRMSVGSNSASMWWLNGEEAVILSGDRRMVKDDCLSRRITLKKGKNIIRGALINGPGMSDFCLRFVRQDGTPVTNITISNH